MVYKQQSSLRSCQIPPSLKFRALLPRVSPSACFPLCLLFCGRKASLCHFPLFLAPSWVLNPGSACLCCISSGRVQGRRPLTVDILKLDALGIFFPGEFLGADSRPHSRESDSKGPGQGQRSCIFTQHPPRHHPGEIGWLLGYPSRSPAFALSFLICKMGAKRTHLPRGVKMK